MCKADAKSLTSSLKSTRLSEVKKKVECIGNKIPLEKRLNIQASNGFFSKKQESYRKSNIAIARSLANIQGDWTIDNIDERNIRILSWI